MSDAVKTAIVIGGETPEACESDPERLVIAYERVCMMLANEPLDQHELGYHYGTLRKEIVRRMTR